MKQYKYSKHHNSKIGPKEAKFICENYGKMGSIKLSKHLNINRNSIIFTLKINNIKLLKPRGSIKIFSPKIESEICEQYKNGMTKQKLGIKYDASENVIKRILKINNIKIRSRSEAQGKKSPGHKNLAGYIVVYLMESEKKLNPNKTSAILQHRLIMARHLNRPLESHENVHHINGKRDDNRLENLELWSTSQPSRQKVTDKIKWAEDLLKFYKTKGYK